MTGQVTENKKKKNHLVLKGKAEYRWKRLMKYFIECMFTLLSLLLTWKGRVSVLPERKKMGNFLTDKTRFISVNDS